MSRRTEVRIFTDENANEAIDYIVRCRASSSGQKTKLFISLSETKHHGTFYTESFKFDIHDIGQFAEDVAKEISSILRLFTVTYEGFKYIDTPNDQLDIEQLMSKAQYLYSPITRKNALIPKALIFDSAAVSKRPVL